MQHFTKLKVWAKAHELNISIYKVTCAFPNSTRYTIVSQLQRCGASVPANIVEGTACSSDRETARFLIIARRSAAEAEYFLLMARDVGLLSQTKHEELSRLAVETQRMLNRFVAFLRHPSRKSDSPAGRLPADG